MINRRELLKLISLGVIGHTLDLDRLLWIPGEKKIFLPPITTWSTPYEYYKLERELYLKCLQKNIERNSVFFEHFIKDYKRCVRIT